MDLLNIQSHLQESARRAAGSFLSPLTNAIGEQRRLVDSLAVVSKVRVEECKHMMVWSKSQVQKKTLVRPSIILSARNRSFNNRLSWLHDFVRTDSNALP